MNKRYIFTFLAFLFIFNINAQSDKTWILGSQLGYNYNENMSDYNNGAISIASFNPYFDKSRSFTNNIYLGRKIGENLFWGIGLDLLLIKTQKRYEELSQSGNPITDIRTTLNINKTTKYSPFIYLEYNYAIGSKFYLVAKSYFQYDLYKFKESNEVTDVGGYSENVDEQNQQYVTISIQPAIRYDLFRSFGIELNLGKIGYSKQTMDSEENLTDVNPNRMEINFKPQNWLVGIYFRF